MRQVFDTIGRLALLLAVASAALLTEPRAQAGSGERPIEVASAEIEFFEKRIRPVLVERCLECHGQGGASSGGLQLDSRAGWQLGGDSGTAVVPGDPEASLLFQAVAQKHAVLKMPPDGKLPDPVIDDFRRWILDGAADPRGGSRPVARVDRELDLQSAREHWAYQPPQVERPPPVHGDWAHAPIDRFILARLEQAGLTPAPDADPRTLIRRLTFDLHGLPPTPEEIERFLADQRPDAYERLVDRLLASPRFGERWGRHWLDVFRFGESLTLRGFVRPEAWRFRDYLIDSLNDDRPYDELVRHLIAGDLLPASSVRQRQRQLAALTFLTLGNINLELQDKAQLRMDVVDEQLEAIGRGLLAQTLDCARCHDHKFDPIPTRDYYALAGILRSTKTLEHANVSQWLEEPLPLPSEQQQYFERIEQRLARVDQQLGSARQELAALTAAPDRVVLASELPGVVVDDQQAIQIGSWQHSQYVRPYVNDGYLHDMNDGQGTKTVTFQPSLPRAGRYEVRLAYTPGDNRAGRVPVTVFSADGEAVVYVDQRREPPIDGLWVSLGRHRFEAGDQYFVMVANDQADGHVIADAVQFLDERQVERVEEVDLAVGAQEERRRGELEREIQRLEADRRELAQQLEDRPKVMTVRDEQTIEDARVHVRGTVHHLGETVPRGFLQVASPGPMPPMPDDQSGRVELAEWLASPQNPLTARVAVNRAWHWVFGAGLVRTTDNFGTMGELPSHPQLLDHLAQQFMRHGWSVKSLVRQLVLSRTYRMSAQWEHEVASVVDPDNRLLWRANRQRLEAECIRDAMLVASGELDLRMGGSAIPPGLANDYGFQNQSLRRSVYLPVLRNSLPELLEQFDFPNPSMVTGERTVSTVAPQSLLLLNDPWVQQRARDAAIRLVGKPAISEPDGSNAQRWIERVFVEVLGRPPDAGELQFARQYVQQLVAERMDESAGEPGGLDQARIEAATRLIHALFGSLDFRYVD